jgi:FtsP/CotA-like multicopper oxidase with cupredoxin domain
MTSSPKHFPSDIAGVSPSVPRRLAELRHGEAFDLRIAPVTKTIGESTVRMLAYNGSVPGPTLKVAQGSEVTVNVENRGDVEGTVHWHGLRLDSRYDGTHETQEPIRFGERFAYRLQFPDPGAYWYHPHVRQDYAQEMGLYGSILVAPEDRDYWAPAHRELLVTLDDVLIEDGRVAPFEPERTTYSAMGRFGNHLLVNGETELDLSVRKGEVVRFYFTNTANTRVFNVAVRSARMTLVGGDSGRCEHEEFVDSAVLGPSERVVVDVLFDATGEAALEHRTPERTYHLGTIPVAGPVDDDGPTEAFETRRTNADMLAERQRLEAHRDRGPDRTLVFVAEMDFEAPEGAVLYVCPMHPEIVRTEPHKCPECGMKLMPTPAVVAFTCPMHPDVVSDQQGTCPYCAMKLMPTLVVPAAVTDAAAEAAGHGHHHEGDGGEHGHAVGAIEWEDDMVDVNRGTTSENTRWKVIDRASGAAGKDIDWRFRVGDQVKLRLVNEMDSDHPMHHPFHIHGAGRFLVLARDGVPDPNLVWSDTVLVKTGEVVDILLDVTHPGRWMAHCHIAEHHESGMAFSFEVAPSNGA